MWSFKLITINTNMFQPLEHSEQNIVIKKQAALTRRSTSKRVCMRVFQ